MKVYLVHFVNQYDEHILQTIYKNHARAEQACVESAARRVKDNMFVGEFYVEEMTVNEE